MRFRPLKFLLTSILFLFVIVAGAVIYITPAYRQQVIKALQYSKCDTPIAYKIGTIDSKFGLSQQEVMQDLQTASDIWSNAYGKELFSYNENASLTVNFNYDERTYLGTTINQLQNKLNQENMTYQQQVAEYETAAAAFSKKLSAYNATVSEYNQKGGAPADIYKNLTEQQKELQSEAVDLNAEAKKLNLSASGYNIDVQKLNQNINEFNTAISTKPEEGLYDPNNNTITIYFALNHDELIHTLAHEFGHALDMVHVSDPNAIMYAYTSQLITPTAQDKEQLAAVCSERSILIYWDESIYNLYTTVVRPFTEKLVVMFTNRLQ